MTIKKMLMTTQTQNWMVMMTINFWIFLLSCIHLTLLNSSIVRNCFKSLTNYKDNNVNRTSIDTSPHACTAKKNYQILMTIQELEMTIQLQNLRYFIRWIINIDSNIVPMILITKWNQYFFFDFWIWKLHRPTKNEFSSFIIFWSVEYWSSYVLVPYTHICDTPILSI